MSALRTIIFGSVIGFVPLAASAAPPLAPLQQRNPAIINVQSTYCDYRGCFGFGPQQWHRPAYIQPNYRPPEARGPTYYQPRAQPRRQLSYDPPPIRRIRPPAKGMHVEWCRNQYRTYNPRTDRFVTYEGIYKTCNSPFD
ncbi:BA14K family protein [Rhizobium mongolense]|uniref:BA14K family protein n=1 Tax=Rhizobium TaxID=379 RepID=UPI00188EBF1E|nr:MULTISPECIES: BA14K family protein [Rhizobium]QPB19861.1 BA14K family protein [Rhizobium sp. 007]ULJ71335.1 BA14K family protein [Rhizobium gallicum]WFU87418.1 BA14K family protein [Rhizobium sp. CC1099]